MRDEGLSLAVGQGLTKTNATTDDRRESGSRTSPRRIVILGSTGSIGLNAIDVVDNCPGRFEVVGLSAHSRWQVLFRQAARLKPRWVAITDPTVASQVASSELPPGTELLRGPESVCRMVGAVETQIVVAAMVGAAGLLGACEALRAGKLVALANKETLVMAGARVTELAASGGGRIIPVDSEHSAIFQALAGHAGVPNSSVAATVQRIVLTGSGGPFRGKKAAELQNAPIEAALKHPTWQMGRKISIDSATLMNKALEVIEARWLFDLPPEKIDVIIHPESIVHSFVEFCDGSILAQLSPPDMRLPIQYALDYPERLPGPARRLDWSSLRALHFEPPDRETFEALDLGFEVARRGGTCGAVLNAANEAAVELFLEGQLPFLAISRACKAVLAQHRFSPNPSLEELMTADQWARQEVYRWTRQPITNGTR